MRKKKKRNPLARVPLRYPNMVTVVELSRILQVTIFSVKAWAGWWRDRRQYVIDDFPKMIVYGKHYVFRLEEVQQYLKIQFDNPYLVDPLMTAGQVAEKLGRSLRTVWKLVKSGKIEAVKFGINCTRFEQRHIEQFEKENKDWLRSHRPPLNVIEERRKRQEEEQRRKERIRSGMKNVGQEMRERMLRFKKKVGK